MDYILVLQSGGATMTNYKFTPEEVRRITDSIPDRRSNKTVNARMEEVTYIKTITITCKFCGSKNIVKYGKKGLTQYYLCRDCKRTFIATAINLFYSGLSIDAIRRQLDSIYHVYPSDSTVYEWVVRFSKVAVNEARISNIKVGDLWIADETVLKIDGRNVWFWDVIDDQTHFLLASRVSYTRTTRDAQALFEQAAKRAGKAPKAVITDKLYAYLDGLELTFGGDTEHIQSQGFTNTNLIERFHGTLKARTKVMRGLKNIDTAIEFTDGWLINYNFFRPHEALRNKTPAEVAKAEFPYKSWEEVVIGGTKQK
jgi:putative transposase